MIPLDREHLQIMMEAGYILLGMRRFKDARDLFEGLSILAPGSEIPLVALGNVDFCDNRLGAALKHYRQALKLDPQSVFAKVYMGETMIFSGQQEEGLEMLREVAKIDKGGAGEFARALLDAVKDGFEPAGRKSTSEGEEV